MNLFVDHLDANNKKVTLTTKYVANEIHQTTFLNIIFYVTKMFIIRKLFVALYVVTVYKILINCKTVLRMCKLLAHIYCRTV